MACPRVLIAEDHPMFRNALALTMRRLAPEAEVVELDSHAALSEALHAGAPPAFVVLDLRIPGAVGLSTLVHLRSECPQTPVAVVSGGGDTDVIERVRQLGARAYVSKVSSTETIEAALNAALNGESWFPAHGDTPESEAREHLQRQLGELTTQQYRVLRYLTEGLLNKQIAAELGISEGTVRAHVTAILQKLGVATRTQAVLLVTELDLAGN